MSEEFEKWYLDNLCLADSIPDDLKNYIKVCAQKAWFAGFDASHKAWMESVSTL